MAIEVLVSLFLAWQFTEGVFGQIFSSWTNALAFGASWFTAFFLCFAVHEYVKKRSGEDIKAEPFGALSTAVVGSAAVGFLYIIPLL